MSPALRHIIVMSCPFTSCHVVAPIVQALSEAELSRVLTEPKNALTKQYARIFGKNSTKFHITEVRGRGMGGGRREGKEMGRESWLELEEVGVGRGGGSELAGKCRPL